MFVIPQVEEIIELALSMGVRFSAEEAAVCQEMLVNRLGDLDEFVQACIEEDRPPLLYPSRDPGHRPLAIEDPFNAWMWRCQIGGGRDGLLTGKTVSFKDHMPVAGIPLTFGSLAMEGFVPDFDATIVTRVLAAGGTVIGKNVMNGFAGGKSSGGGVTLGDFWRPLNPHHVGHITGGSSSGAGAAVAAREVDVAFGGDQGGSIRVPAAYCGVIGLKPTFGLVSHMGLAFGSEQSVDHVGPIARYVEDVAAALEAVAGYDGYDPRQLRAVPEHIDVMSGLHDGVDGIRIAVLEEGFTEPIEDDVRDSVLEALDVLVRAGATIERVSIPAHCELGIAYEALVTEGGAAIFDSGPFGMWAKTYYPTSIVTAMSKLIADHGDLIQPRTTLLRMLAEFSRRNFHGAAYSKAHNVRPTYVRAYDNVFERFDVLAMPTCRTVAPRAGDVPGDRREAVLANLRMDKSCTPHTLNTRPFDYTGHPALALPCGKSGQLPTSLQLVGRHFADPLLMRVGFAYQASVDWERQLSLES